jgi:ABC-type transport system involved in multi-copper enzyme maturation permease subunit
LLLCALALFLALPVRLAMELSVESRRILQDPSWTGGKTIGEWLGSIFMQNLSNSLFSLLVFFLAILLAVQGFSWMDSRRKLDLYMSVPVSARKRFTVIYLNGGLIFAACYLVMLVLTLVMGAVMGAVSGKVLLYALIMYIGNLLFFMVCYNVALVAVMLTGNVLVSLLAAAVLFFYEYVVRWLLDGMRSSFFAPASFSGVRM